MKGTFISYVVIFWHKNIGAKVAHKILMKLTTGLTVEPLQKLIFKIIKYNLKIKVKSRHS